MGALTLAWLIGEGIIVYRSVKNSKAPPGPGNLLWTSGLFILLAILAESEKARPLAVTLAYGFDIAAFMNLTAPVIKTTGGGTWPPPLLPNTVIFPGQTLQAGSGAGGGSIAKVSPATVTNPNPTVQA